MYELTYIISPLALNTNTVAAKVSAFIADNLGGKVKKEYIGEKKKLSYPIKKQAAGSYVIAEFSAEPEKMDELKKFLDLNTDILRHLILTQKASRPAKRPARIKPTVIALPAEEISHKGEKVKIEELDKKLEELLK
ncbi:30S ribosomal protein S6 [Patescibacteria group bacterium]|nr:30S ribosomal protein S6 [Patescibacteria group bacterium]MBU2219841.1 30S ribosomal protein S6 [Patescibacteria group bacterium]MBU2264904.1 30S ribosomal protein S6 [Patescibacteria group bacterium]